MRLANFINGAFVPPQSGAYFDDFAPASGEVIALQFIPRGDAGSPVAPR